MARGVERKLNMSENVPVGVGGVPLLPRNAVIKVIGVPSRWAILTLLGDGQPKMVSELAQALNWPLTTVSKQLHVMKAAGVVVKGQAGMYRIPAQFFPQPGKPLVDFGYCVLRLDVREPD